MINYPYISRINERRVDYFDRDGNNSWIAVFEDLYPGAIKLYMRRNKMDSSNILEINNQKLNNANDYKNLLIEFGYYGTSQ